jgi:anaerobic ribonucleoside-triphosphate reductase activating protein
MAEQALESIKFINSEVVKLASPIQSDSIVDGDGLRAVIWCQGCDKFCKGCHNPKTWDLNGGKVVKIESLISKLSQLKGQAGITFSGGEPMIQASACKKIAEWAKQEMRWSVWCFSGYTYEEIKAEGGEKWEFLKCVDVLIDGRFDISKKDISLKFKGSSNQRLTRLDKGYVVSTE